jgi:MFS family permease
MSSLAWAYEITGKATLLALVGLFLVTSQIALAPFIGVLVDRGNRKLLMIMAVVLRGRRLRVRLSRHCIACLAT